jgi:hypothetical protein
MAVTNREKRVRDDVLRGLQAIADELGMTVRQVHYGLTEGHIPGGREGNTWISSKEVLREHYRELATMKMKKAATA